jgi:dTDP-4-dehydrorhamnose reductase
MRLLVTGGAGMLAREVARAGTQSGAEVLALSHGELDVTDRPAVDSIFASHRPDAVINCAAWTDVDGAERARESAFAINVEGAGNVARAAAASGAWTIHISSDYVFDGAKREPYVESDAARPLSAYGRSKHNGELAVASEAPHAHTVVRSSWLFGAGGVCFPETILRLAQERDELTVVDDQIGCPTFTGHLAPALVELAGGRRVPGTLHVAAAGQCSWFEFAAAIVAAAGVGAAVTPCRTADMQRPATRPAYSVLHTERGAPRLPEWREGLEAFLGARVP